jgi:hypothetical protein
MNSKRTELGAVQQFLLCSVVTATGCNGNEGSIATGSKVQTPVSSTASMVDDQQLCVVDVDTTVRLSLERKKTHSELELS